MTPQEAGADSTVSSMTEFLSALLSDAERLDKTLEQVHADIREAKEHLRSRLYALRLADDAAFRSDVDRLAEELAAGEAPSTFSLDEVLERQIQATQA